MSHDLAIKALQLIAGKVAASSGDIRQALDLSRRVIEISSEKSAQNKGHGDPVSKYKDRVCSVMGLEIC